MSKRPKILDNWDEIQHDPLSIPPDSFEDMTQEDAVELIRDWFFENFEDPAHSTPYESAEGGYQYIWGGPYNARDIIENVFADTASDELITAAIEAVERDGIEWVPNSRRQQPPEGYEDSPETQDAATLHAEMQRRISAIEKTLARLSHAEAGIGHNNPPGPIEDAPLDTADRHDLIQAIQVLKAQPVEPDDSGAVAVSAVTTLKTTAEKLRDWLARQGDTFVSEAVKEAGKEFGKWAPRALWLYFAAQLLGLSEIAVKWLHTIHPPF